jgi:predicted aspartyl protease
LAGIASISYAQAPSPAPNVAEEENGEVLGLGEDLNQRMTVPVNIGESGPHLFVVDTGAERTVISRQLARELRLDPGRTATVHSMTEVSQIATVVIPELQVGGKSLKQINAPALERNDLGAEGMLGVDTLQSQRVMFDFKRQEMTVTASKRTERRWPSDTIVITARSRFGHLVLVDASVDGQKVWVIVDTGSQATVANNALRRALQRRGRLRPTIPVELMSITGGQTMADQSIVRRIKIGGIDLENMPLAFADVHPFRKLDLMDKPAILLGMDALQLFERVSVDFANRKVKILLPGRSGMQVNTRVARAGRLTPES